MRNMSRATPTNPQAEPMAHESMVRNLAAQAEAIWPQERPLFQRYGLSERARILDVGCATGYIAILLAQLGHQITGIELNPAMAAEARSRGVQPELPGRYLRR